MQAGEKIGMRGKHPSTTSGGMHRRILTCVILAAVTVVAVAAALLLQQADGTGSSVQEEAAQQEPYVRIGVSGEGYAAAASTPVFLHIEGDDASGDVFMDSSGSVDVELPSGDYTVTVAAPSIDSDGSVFGDSDGVPATMAVSEGDNNAEIPVAVAAIDPADVSYEDMQKAYSYAEKARVDIVTFDRYMNTALWRHKDAVDAQEAASQEGGQAEDEEQQALAANPSIVHSVPDSQESEVVTLTGTLRMETKSFPVHPDQQEDVYCLELPSKITVTGTQYGDQSDTNVIVHQLQTPSGADISNASYVGKTISVTGQVSVNATGSDPSFDISMLNFFDDALLTKAFS